MVVNIKIRRLAALAFLGLLLTACDKGESGAAEDAAGEAAEAVESAPEATRTGEDAAPQESTARQVDSETLAYAEVDDELVRGYFAFPSDMIEPLPAVIVIHDWWGINDDTRASANRLAAEGYMVLAVDLYDGEIADDANEARERMISVIENPHNVEENVRQALEFVGFAGAPSIASLGWGFGGSWSMSSAMLFPNRIDAAVVYYGQVSSDEDKLRGLRAPILGLFGARDRSVTAESVLAFEQAMQRIRYPHVVHSYPDAGHGFADPARGSYNEATTEDAWQRTIEFLAANLELDEES